MKIERNDAPVIAVTAIAVGTVFDCDLKGRGPFLRTFEGVVDLSDPMRTWSLADDRSGFEVSDYRPLRAKVVVED